MTSGISAFQFIKFRSKREHLEAVQTEQKFNSGHSRKFSGPSRGKLAYFKQFDSRQQENFTPERFGICFLRKKYLGIII